MCIEQGIRDFTAHSYLSELSPLPMNGDNSMKAQSNITATSNKLIAIATSLAFLLMAPPADAAGRTVKSIANTILSGKGLPKTSLGIDGDFYIDTRSLLIYGPKRKGRWPSPTNLQGPTGPAGPSGSAGKNGSDGRTITSASTVAGPVGAQGAPGPVGPVGPVGPQGLIGPQGPAGSPGTQGAPGVAGAPGPAGSPGTSGGVGPAGPTGMTGATGAVGATGPAGLSEVTVVDIPEWILSSAAPFSYANSLPFGSLTSGNSYFFDIHLSGISASNNLVLGVEILTSANEMKYSFSRNDFRFSTATSVNSGYGLHIFGTVKAGSGNSSFIARIFDGLGDSGAAPLTLKGTAYITLVGSIK